MSGPGLLGAVAALALLAVASLAGCTPRPDAKIARGLWVTRWDYETADDVRLAIERAADAGFDTVFFQVRGNATTFYPSDLEPWAEEFGFTDPGFDPLAVACETARVRGIALHAWVNAVPGWRGAEPPPVEAQQLYHTRPDWFLVDAEGERQPLVESYVALNPCRPDVRAHIAAVCAEVARYPVDGVHLDYIRFIEVEPGHDYPHDPVTRQEYTRATGEEPGKDPESWERWRRDQVTVLVREIRAAVREANPDALLTAAVYRTPRIALGVKQDWVRWLREGSIDVAIPMVYHSENAAFETQVDECVRAAAGYPLVIGLGTYKHSDPEQTARQETIALRLGAAGISHFAYSSFFPAGPAGGETTEKERAARRERLLRRP